MKKIAITMCALLIVLSGCKGKETTPSAGSPAKQTLVIGLIPEQNIFKQIEKYTPLADYLSEKLGLKIQLKILARYGNIINNFQSERMDGAFLGSFTGALAHSKLGLEFIARPENLNGISTYRGLIFVRKDSGINKAGDMKGKIFAFVDKATTAGYLLPLAYFKMNGIRDYKKYLKETYFSGTHEDVIRDVLNRKADIGAAKDTVYYRIAQSDRGILDELSLLEKSPEVPENALVLRKDMDNKIKKRLKELLLNMHNDPEGEKILKTFGARKFIETTINDYEPVFKYAREIGLDLATYDYLND
ncbi:MAG: phosphate/phosphite/phosphonate ABC transporter substrate-binding protein [Nitrospirae bacterium]|nr:phosphate/phosphite/phosphonate ABC transporter substrate-binding protein [Nitrospirota bacterium]